MVNNQISFLETTTTSFKQSEILTRILKLHCPQGIEADVTYSIGSFYSNGIPRPKYRFDMIPKTSGIVVSDCRKLPIPENSFTSLIFDPPFVGGGGKEGIIISRFGNYPNIPKLWDMYRNSLAEFARVLKPNGVLIFKCQDTVEGGKNWFSHVAIMNMAVSNGFYPKDLFVLLAKYRMGMWHSDKQHHARKYHSYFWVFEKMECPINYTERITNA